MTETDTTYEPVSISPAADGWRAAYIHDPDEGAGWSAEPLIAWAVYEVTTNPVQGSTALEQSHGRQILGVIFAEGYAQCAQEASSFWYYLAPGDPDPSRAQVVAEQAERWPPGIDIPGVGRVGARRIQ
jgi:hypothetical protein